MKRVRFLIALIACLLSVNSFAAWRLEQRQGNQGSWASVLPPDTKENALRHGAIICPLGEARIVNTETGEIQAVACGARPAAAPPAAARPVPSNDRIWIVDTLAAEGMWDRQTRRMAQDQAIETARSFCAKGKKARVRHGQEPRTYLFSCEPGQTGALTEPEAVELARQVQSRCNMNPLMKSLLDCACVGESGYAEVRKNPAQRSHRMILSAVTKNLNPQCIKRQAVFDYGYEPCEDVLSRRADAKQFCTCVANTMADGFMQNRAFSINTFDRYRNLGFKQCGATPGSAAVR